MIITLTENQTRNTQTQNSRTQASGQLMSGVLVSLVIMAAEEACCIAFEVFLEGVGRELCELLRGRMMSSDKELMVR